jgi:RND family efflux transporter MFP subunit
MNKAVAEGQRIQPGQPLMQLNDLSRIWLIADVYEQDLPWVRVGTQAEIEIPYQPGRPYTGRVDHLYVMLNPETRTVQARIVLPGASQGLRPGMYAIATLSGQETPPRPVVPEEAVLHTGARSMVIEALGGGRFRPREVETGLAADGVVQVLDGLSGGEEIVTRAQFLIDSEARLQSALGAMLGGHQHGGDAPVN